MTTASARGIEAVDAGDQCRALQEVVERREPHFPALVGHRLGGPGDQLAHVVHALLPLGALVAQVLVVADGVDQVAQQLVHRGVACALAEVGQQARELGQAGARGRPKVLKQFRPGGRREQRQAMRPRRLGERGDGGVAEAAPRRGDGAAECFVVVRIGDELQVRHEIADLAAIVEAHGADEPVGNGPPAHRLFHGAALRVGAVEDREIAQHEPARAGPSRGDLLGHEVGLVALVGRAHQRDALTARLRRAQRLAAPGGVGGDHVVRELEDARRGAVVLLEAHDRRVGEVLLEVEDVADVGATPAVDGLVVVADHHDVAVLRRRAG